MKWTIENNGFFKNYGYYLFLPYVRIWYDKYRFLETGVYTPAFGINIGWLNFGYSLTIQQSY